MLGTYVENVHKCNYELFTVQPQRRQLQLQQPQEEPRLPQGELPLQPQHLHRTKELFLEL